MDIPEPPPRFTTSDPAIGVPSGVVSAPAEPRNQPAPPTPMEPNIPVIVAPAAARAVAPEVVYATAAARLDALIDVRSGGGPSAPPESPVSWATLAAVRRQSALPRVIAAPAATVGTGQALLSGRLWTAIGSKANRAPVISTVTVGVPNAATGAVKGKVQATDPNRDRITFRAKTSSRGSVSITAVGVFTYTPTGAARHAAAKIGAAPSALSDTVTVTVTDSKGAATNRTVTVPISPKNSVPVTTTTVGAPLTTTGVVTGSVRASDADGDVRTYAGSTTTGKGSVTVSSSTGDFTYTPTAIARHDAAAVAATTATKSDAFTVTVTDGYGGKVAVPVTVQIAPRNTAPVASSTIAKPDPVTGVAKGVVTASDADRDTLIYSATKPLNGTVSINTDGSFSYVPTAAARGTARTMASAQTDTFSITVNDRHGGTAAVTVTATIAASNSAPVGGTPTINADPGTGVVTGSVNASDPDKDPLTYTPLNTSTAKGSVAVGTTGAFTYTPTAAARQNASVPNATLADKTDTFAVAVTDKYGATGTVSVSVPVMAAGAAVLDRMAVGMNLENVVDWSPAWTFTDAFKASRPWISHTFNPQTWSTTWDEASAPLLDLDADGNVRSLKTWTQNGVQMKQYAGTLMFDALDGGYAGGTYHAEWDGKGVVTFGFDAKVTSTGKTAAGRNFAELAVTPTDSGIYMRIEATDPADPVRNVNIWMPDYNGQSFRGQRWQPGASFSPFHPLFLARLAPFTTLRFMGMQETNSTDVVTWDQRRDAKDIRQGSGSGGTPSEPIVNGMSLEYMVELANELDADPWFNMPYQADDTFVRSFATYVSQHLEPGRTVYVEWANEVWNFGWGFEASQWVSQQARAQGLDPDYGQWIVAGREAKRDLAIWSDVFATQPALKLVRVAAGWAAVDWVTNQIAENMAGTFDAIAIAPYITPTDEQRAGYTASTTVDQIIADTRTNIATSLQWTTDHEQLARDWSARLGRPIELLAYEGGPHLDGRNALYQNAFYAATNDARMGDIYRQYLTALDAAGMDLYVDFQFTGQAGAAPWGDFAKLHRMDEPLTDAYRYNAVTAAADGSLWSSRA